MVTYCRVTSMYFKIKQSLPLPESDKLWADGGCFIIQFGGPGLWPHKVVVKLVFARGAFLPRHELKRVKKVSI